MNGCTSSQAVPVPENNRSLMIFFYALSADRPRECRGDRGASLKAVGMLGWGLTIHWEKSLPIGTRLKHRLL